MQSYSVETVIQAIQADRTLIKKFWKDYSLGYIGIDDLLPARELRRYGSGKPCACCGKIMTYAQRSSTPVDGWLQEDGWEDGWWKNPRNVTIDHRYPKSLFPDLMFDINNMELICHRCNQDKGDLFGKTIFKDCENYAVQFRSRML